MRHADETELVVLPAATAEDRARLRRRIDDEARLERLVALRAVLCGALAALSGPLWLRAAFPHVLPGATPWILAVWVPAALAWCTTTVSASLARRRATRRADCTIDPTADRRSATPRPR